MFSFTLDLDGRENLIYTLEDGVIMEKVTVKECVAIFKISTHSLISTCVRVLLDPWNELELPSMSCSEYWVLGCAFL